jgi:hypothetical protein
VTNVVRIEEQYLLVTRVYVVGEAKEQWLI